MTRFASDSQPVLLAAACLCPATILLGLKELRRRKEALLPAPSSLSTRTSRSQPTSPISQSHQGTLGIDSAFQYPEKMLKDSDDADLTPFVALDSTSVPTPQNSTKISIEPVPFLAIYRAHMMLLTLLAILAVDFPLFPRFLAKCESFGVSLVSETVSLLEFDL